MSKSDEAKAEAAAATTTMATLTIAEDNPCEEWIPPSILHFLFEALTLVVSVIILLLMVIYPVLWPMFYLGFGFIALASGCGVVAIRTRLYGFHIPCIICSILGALSFLSIIVITAIMVVVMFDEWEYEHLIVYVSFNVIWTAVAVTLVARHIILFRQRRTTKTAQPLSYKPFGG